MSHKISGIIAIMLSACMISGCGASAPSSSAGSEASSQPAPAASEAPAVYMTTDISPSGLMKAYEALERTPSGNVAVKLSTGEPGSNYLRVDLIGELVKLVNGTIVECNTAYGGARASTAMHLQVARDHGYTDIANVDIMDAGGSIALPVSGGTNLTENFCRRKFSKLRFFFGSLTFQGTCNGRLWRCN